MAIPLPDFDDSDDGIPQPIYKSPERTICRTLSVGRNLNPLTSFTSLSPNGLRYDRTHPLYETKTCTLYLASNDTLFFILKSSTKVRLLQKEWDMYRRVGPCPTITKAFDSWKVDRTFFIQLEFAYGGSIQKALFYMDLQTAWRIFAHISLAIACIHQHGLIHMDISPSNILQFDIPKDGNSIFKLTDFGTVVDIYDGQSGAGPYVAPETLLFPSCPVNQHADIWSLGATIYEVVTHSQMPRDTKGYEQIRNGLYDLSLIPPEFAVIKTMLDPNPLNRPSIHDILLIPQIQAVLSTLDEDFRALQELDDTVFLEQKKLPAKTRRTSFDDI